MNQVTQTPPKVDMNAYVGKYVQLRDKIKELDDAHKQKMKPYKDALEQLGGMLLDELNNSGSNSMATDSGTCYRTEKKSASIADGEAFMAFVISNNAWDLLDRKANAKAIEERLEAGDDLPPGVNFSKVFVVGVRRK